MIQAQGLALHDSHAEILAIRGFNRFPIFSPIKVNRRFLLDEIIKVQNDGSYQSPWLVSCEAAENNFLFRFNVNAIFLFISGTPCGDASLDLLGEDPDNAAPWTRPEGITAPSALHGHEYIWEHGKVRFKPGTPLPDIVIDNFV